MQGINLQIESGEVFGIIGRSGAGKSSLVRCLNLLNRPTSGQVLVGGRDLMQLSDAELRTARRDIGMVFQHFNLLSSRTVFDNAALPLELAGMSADDIKKRVDPLLDLVGLSALRDRYPAQISAGKSSAWALRARWPATPRCCCRTKPPRPWTPRPRAPSWTCCARSTANWA
ncbi:ATP-binding cassette domain-containing protein [Delftia tsuruhatensis]